MNSVILHDVMRYHNYLREYLHTVNPLIRSTVKSFKTHMLVNQTQQVPQPELLDDDQLPSHEDIYCQHHTSASISVNIEQYTDHYDQDTVIYCRVFGEPSGICTDCGASPQD